MSAANKKNATPSAPKKQQAAASKRAPCVRVADTQLEQWIDPTDRSTRTLLIHRAGDEKEFVYRSDDGIVRWCSNNQEVRKQGRLTSVVDPERLAAIPEEFRRPKNEDLFVDVGQHKDGCRYSFDEVARWHSVAGAHLGPSSAPATPFNSPVKAKVAAKSAMKSGRKVASDVESDAGKSDAESDACDTDLEDDDVKTPRRKPSKAAIAAAMEMLMMRPQQWPMAPSKPALKCKSKTACKLDFDAHPSTGRVTKANVARRVHFA